MKHKFTKDDSNVGNCGEPYCRGNCGTVYFRCTCGWYYIGHKDVTTEVAHVLVYEGLYE